MEAMQAGQVDQARELLIQALDEGGERPDLLHGLGAVELQLGMSGDARPRVERAIELLEDDEGPHANEMRAHFLLTLASICEAEDEPALAVKAYRRSMRNAPQSFDAPVALGRLQLAMGDLERGLGGLERLLQQPGEGAPAGLEDLAAFVQAARRWISEERPARRLLQVHRDAYCSFFDHHADRMAAEGWIAEAARMRRVDGGDPVLDIPAGARTYAGVRVDLVDPRSGQGGLVGDQPMIVGVPEFTALARTPVLMRWQGLPLDLRVSTQCPWDQLPVQLMLVDDDPEAVLDPLVSEWYSAGFDGRFGSSERGRFHYISEPEHRRRTALVYQLDLGRAELSAIDDLVERLVALHARYPLRRVVLGRGHLPPGA